VVMRIEERTPEGAEEATEGQEGQEEDIPEREEEVIQISNLDRDLSTRGRE
jgi:hypothetical protein